MKPCVLKIGGSVVLEPGFMESISSVVKSLKRMPLGIVVGGGATNQKYVDIARPMGVNDFYLDLIGISVSRLNALLLATTLDMSTHIPESVEEAADLMQYDPVIIGGTVPGHTTNAVAALLAEATGARLVNATNVSGIYDKDPNKSKNAKRIKTLSYSKLVAMAAENDKRQARSHFVFDLLAAKILARSKTEAHVIKGTPSEIRKACFGKAHGGTVIK